MSYNENMIFSGNPFAVLGVEPEASCEEIRLKYLELVKKFPPDREPEKFKIIRSAYEKLKDLPQRLETILFYAAPFTDTRAIETNFIKPSKRNRIPLLELIRECRKK